MHEGKLFECPECTYKGNRKVSLNEHINRIHGGEKKFECPECEHVAKHESYLKLHIHSISYSLIKHLKFVYSCYHI